MSESNMIESTDKTVLEQLQQELASGRSRREIAMANFLKGYNCAQAVTMAFVDQVDVDEKTLSRLACSFGGGMGRLREVCGSVSGMFMLAGLIYGYDGPETGAPKADQYARIQELARRFEAQNGSIVCRELLGLSQKRDIPVPEARTDTYYKKRPCKEIIGCAAEIFDSFLQEHPVKK